MTRLITCALISALSGIGLSRVMTDYMPACPDEIRGVICGVVAAGALFYLWLADLHKAFLGE